MKRTLQWTYRLAAGALLALPSGSAAQYVAAANYPVAQQQAPPVYSTAAKPGYATPPAQNFVAPPAYSTAAPAAVAPVATPYSSPTAYKPAPTTAYAIPPVTAQPFAAPGYGAPAYAAPRVAQAEDLPSPDEAVGAVTPELAPAQMTPAQVAPGAAAPSVMTYDGGYTQPTNHMQPSYAAPTGVAASGGCATGNCGTAYSAAPAPAMSYGGCETGSCATGTCGVGYDNCYAPAAPACDVGCAPVAAPRRQWFVGVYGLYLDRIGDQGKAAVAYLADSGSFTDDYYPTSDVPTLFTSDAETGDLFGAEIRFGSTFGCDPCSCGQPFAWEIGYWGLGDDSNAATLLYPGTVGFGNNDRIYTLYNYNGVEMDLDGAGTTWDYRPVYDDNGMPADDDLDANDVRVVGVRVRQRFSVQNLELNFWRFGTPVAAGGIGLGGGRLGAGGCGVSGSGAVVGACGADACGGCAPAACAPCRPPRRFFINGLAGVRYLRVDDDFGLDQQFTLVGTDPTNVTEYRNPRTGWPTAYEGFPIDDNSVLFSDFEANNDLIGLQLGCSMNWLVGCRWNLFADTNFGVYGNNAQVNKRIYGGGDSVVRFINGGGPTDVSGSDTSIAYVGELRAGVGYQVSCRCRVTAAYRFIGIGGVALGVEEFQNTNWSNATTAAHIDTNNSIILHGLQTGVEWTY